MTDIKQLLTDMRCEVVWSHVATMPIPLYERMKAVIQEYADIVSKQEKAEAERLKRLCDQTGIDGHSCPCNKCNILW